MNKWKVVIVDDEEKSTDIISYMLEKYCPEFEIVSVINNPREAVQYLEATPPDLLFLDIQMPELDGFQVLDALTAIDFKVIFVTAFDEFALKAFKYYALDYILKPIEVDELKKLTKHLLSQDQSSYNKSDFLKIFQEMTNKEPQKNQLAVPTSNGVVFMLFEDIVRLEADSNYSYLHKSDGTKVYAAKTLKYFENLLPSDKFFRPHQSHIVNLEYMDQFVRTDGGFIKMKDGQEIILARSKRKEFIDRFIN